MIILQQNENIINITLFWRSRVSISKYYTNKKRLTDESSSGSKTICRQIERFKNRNRRNFKIISDPKSLLRNRQSYANIIKNTILPFLDQVSDVCKQSSKELAPIPSLEYVHRTNEAKIKEKLRELELKCDKEKAKRRSLIRIE